MNYFLAFFPTQEANFKIRKTVGELGRVFDGQDIDVRWLNPEKFHIASMFLGTDLSFVKRKWLEYTLSKINIPSFNISFNKAELGISRKYKELVYLTVLDGGDELRDLVYRLREELKIEDPGQYIPHLTLGRVNKDLTPEEFKNLTHDVRAVNKELKLQDISFITQKLSLVVSDDGKYSTIKEF